MTRNHCGPHYYNTYIYIKYIYIYIFYIYVHTYIYIIYVSSARSDKTSEKHDTGKEKRQGDVVARCNNPATLFDATVRERGR